MQFKITSAAQIWKYTLAITALSVAAPVLVVGGVMAMVPHMPLGAMLFGVSIAFFIPLLIAPPISYLGLSMLRLLSDTISKVDQHVKFDPLTGALNRSHFLDNVRARQGSGVLMIVDVDHFKNVNDTRGHAAGDEALCILVRALGDALGPKGIIGRMGGEEFGVYLPGADLASGKKTANMLCRTLRQLDMIVGGKPMKMTISIGGTLHPAHFTIGHSLKIADDRLYLAKHEGRDRAVLEDPAQAGLGSVQSSSIGCD
jgi:diguanylate cyclase